MIRFIKILDAIMTFLIVGCGLLIVFLGILSQKLWSLIVGIILGLPIIILGFKKYLSDQYFYTSLEKKNELEIEKKLKHEDEKTIETIKYINIPTDYIVLDTETTGLSPRYDDIIEIGAIKIQNGIIIDEFQTYCKPLNNIKNSEIHNITDEMVENYKYSKCYMNDFLKFIENFPVLIYNADFDTKMINVQLDKNIENKVVDVLNLARKYDTRVSYKLESVKTDLKISIKSHNAIDDCKTTKLYYEYLLQKYNINQLPLFTQGNVAEIKELKLITYADKLLKIYTPENIIENKNFKDKIFVFTGDLKSMTRVDAAKKVIENGGIYHPRIILKANYLVVGDLDKETGKLAQANLYNSEKGTDIKIIYEDDFLNLLNT